MDPVEQAAQWSRDLEGADPAEIIRWSVERFGDGLVIGSSFGRDGLVVIDLARRLRPEIPILFLETGYHFPETLAFRDRLRQEWGVAIRDVRPTSIRPTFLYHPLQSCASVLKCQLHGYAAQKLDSVHVASIWLVQGI